MNLLRFAIRKVVEHRLRRAEVALKDPAAAQKKLLLSFVCRARNTEWGRAHNYDRIASVADFQKAVPLGRYEAMEPYWIRSFDGDRDVACPSHVKFFALSSGTTTGDTKYVPISAATLRANQRSGMTLVGLCERQAPGSFFGSGKAFYFSGASTIQKRGACFEGYGSGINAANTPRWIRRLRLPSPEINDIPDWEVKLETMCRAYMDAPISVIAGLPPWTLLLFRRMIDTARAERGRSIDTLSDLWPGLKAFVSFGMATGPYCKQLKELVGTPIAIVDTYSSSEGGLNAVQSSQDDPSMQLEVDSGVFFEFVPADQIKHDNPERLTLDQVEIGVDYAVLLTTPSGVWAYDVGDLVRFTSLRPPKILIVGRSKLGLSVIGEKLIQEQIDGTLVDACRATGSQVGDFTIQGVPPTAADPRGGHIWLVEFEGPAADPVSFARTIDASLAERSLDYRDHRQNDYHMRPPEVVVLAPGTFYEWARRHGKLGGQHKVPRVAHSDEMADEIRELSKTLSQQRP